MSLPPAPKDISEKPQSGAVTDPVNKAQKDADIDRKVCNFFLYFLLFMSIFGWHSIFVVFFSCDCMASSRLFVEAVCLTTDKLTRRCPMFEIIRR